MKKTIFFKSFCILPALLVVLGLAASCNKKDNSNDGDFAVTLSTVAVKNFSISPNAKILADLDSVFFSIDLNRGVIFNADSLPLGTDISRLIPVITFAGTVSKADLVFEDSKKNEVRTVNYLESATDTIDFSKDVTLNVTAYDGETSCSYRLKVNVHKQKPDSIIWDNLARASLPSRLPDPKAQHSVQVSPNEADGSLADSKVYSLFEESDGSFTLAVSSDIAGNVWAKSILDFPFVPDINSFAASDSGFCILADNGDLYFSQDALQWSPTGENWNLVLGPYMDAFIGIKDSFSMFCHYPLSAEISDNPVDPDFPREGFSALRSIYSKWSATPTAFIAGGRCPNGSLSTSVWAFDGSSWTTINEFPMPGLYGPSIVKYSTFRNTGSWFRDTEYDAWLIIGGQYENGKPNRNVLISIDNCLNWKAGGQLAEFPDAMPDFVCADAVVLETNLDADLSDYWTSTPSRASGRWLRPAISFSGSEISWNCPYIYLIGGLTSDSLLANQIWRGVLSRLTFTPLI